MIARCIHHTYKFGKVVLGTPTNGRSYRAENWGHGEGIWLDSAKPRFLTVRKCTNCGHTIAQSNQVWGY